MLRVERDEALRRAHDAERRAQEVRRATDGERGCVPRGFFTYFYDIY